MGRKKHYVPGSFYQVDDRTGFPERVERTRRQWDNLVVKEARWEPRQPQDFVKGVRDDQSVDQPRPISDPTFYGPIWAPVSEGVPLGATVIPLLGLDNFRLGLGSRIAVMLDCDGGNMFYSYVVSIGLTEIVIVDPLPYHVSEGQQLWNFGPDANGPVLAGWVVGGVPAAPSTGMIIAGTPTASAHDTVVAGTPTRPAGVV